MDIRPITAEELPLASALIAEQQADPERHVCYLGMTAEDIATDLAGLEPLGLAGVLVAVDGDRLLGILAFDHAEEPPRVWWWGPFVFDRVEDPDAVADRLVDAALRLLPETVTQQEFGPDERNTFVARLADRRGLTPDEASVVLNRAIPTAGPSSPASGFDVRAMREVDRDRVAALHDQCFAGAHVPGHQIDKGEDRLVLVAARAGDVTGYVAADRESDGSGYIDFVGVDPAARGQGVGAALVEGACAALRERFGCEVAHLTVRESNAAARRLYAKLGFTEERLIRPWRLGFSLGRGPSNPSAA